MAKAKLLLVDDGQEFLRILSERLSQRGYRPTAVTSGLQAIEAASRECFEVAILDVVMPEMDGLETLTRLRQICPHMPVIMLTGYSTAGKALELGALEVLVKPTDLETLMQHIDRAQALGAARQPDART